MQIILIIIVILALAGFIYHNIRKEKKPIEPIPPPPTPNPPFPEPDPKVYVHLCVLSGKKMTSNCRNMREVQMKQGEVDKLGNCTICKPIPPPPPKPKRPDIMLGASVYQLLEFKNEDIVKFLQSLYETGANCTEIFGSYTWSNGRHWQPFKQVGTTVADDSPVGEYVTLYDLETFDSDYWDKMQFIMNECAKRDITLIIRLLDYCSVKDEDYYKRYCWHSNIQKKKAQEPGGPGWGGFYGDKTRNYVMKYTIESRRRAKIASCNCVYQWLNEPGYNPNAGEIGKWIGRNLKDIKKKDWNLTAEEKATIITHCDAVILEQLAWWNQKLDRCGMNFIGQSMSKNYTRCVQFLKTNGIKWEVHGCNSDVACNDAYVKYGSAIVPNGDGPDPHALGRHGDELGKREPSVQQGHSMGVSFKVTKPKYYGFYIRKVEDPLPADLTRATFDVIKEIIRAYIG